MAGGTSAPTTLSSIDAEAETHASEHQAGGADVIDARGLLGAFLTADTETNRPAAGTAGRYFWATDTQKMYYDDGTAWNAVAAGAVDAHASQHEDGGSDEISVQGLSGDLADAQDPKTHGDAAHSAAYADDPHNNTQHSETYLTSADVDPAASTSDTLADITRYEFQGQTSMPTVLINVSDGPGYIVAGIIQGNNNGLDGTKAVEITIDSSTTQSYNYSRNEAGASLTIIPPLKYDTSLKVEVFNNQSADETTAEVYTAT